MAATLISLAAIIALTFAACASSSATPTSPRQRCLLHRDGREVCEPSEALVSAVRVGGAACARKDIKCWCMKAVKYTNEHRRKKGMTKMFKSGPMRQLDNANRYAGVLARLGRLVHQTLPSATREVQCKRWIGGENIAYNYETGDVAKACVDQWIGSKGHRENMEREWYDEVVIGFHFSNDGRVYCVQTFSLVLEDGTFGSEDAAGCQPITEGGGGPAASGDSLPRDVDTTNSEYPAQNGSSNDEGVLLEDDRPHGAALTAEQDEENTTIVQTEENGSTSGGGHEVYVDSSAGLKSDGEGGDTTNNFDPDAKDPTMVLKRDIPAMFEKLLPFQRRQGNRSCRCLEVGRRCWQTLEKKSRGRCKSSVETDKQPASCKKSCCAYCKRYPTNPTCKNSTVRDVCNSMSLVARS